MADESRDLFSISRSGDGKVSMLKVGYLAGVTPNQFALTMHRFIGRLHKRIVCEPVVISTDDFTPPSWAVPMLVGALNLAEVVALETRQMCVVVAGMDGNWEVGDNFPNPEAPDRTHRANADDRKVRKAG